MDFSKMFDDRFLHRNKSIGSYCVEWYLDCGIVIENEIWKNDQKRRESILQSLWEECLDDSPWLSDKNPDDYRKIIYYRDGEELETGRKIILAIENITWGSPTLYIKK
ncbi:hypothetical protein BC351_10675 [Paenibacillus ferrarius]|uniref:Uncharacterized protein n=1 Tax=Paenibacillus ferrarius TaxID=1469647 RepID=A0A1V4H8V1_9BACL|nr:hypothetical protein [Paenibacillus ferrarius]OPH47645.1 hypothetical protein BC351_10675 [Paenibacillus ferrarius]